MAPNKRKFEVKEADESTKRARDEAVLEVFMDSSNGIAFDRQVARVQGDHQDSDKNPGLDKNKPPLSNFHEIFKDIAKKALELGLSETLQKLQGIRLRVATMCSGTDAPVLALRMIETALRDMDIEPLEFEHVFSAEIEAYKAAFIQRTAAPPIIFRDIEEFDGSATPSTVFGPCKEIPENIDILVAGFACVDFSNLNSWTKSISGAAKDAKKKRGEKTKEGHAFHRPYRRYLRDMDQWFPGESGGTLFAVLDFADDRRPAIVMLENVIGAPWETITRLFARIGYDAHWIKVDTKDYYIPATRQRCYLLAINNGKASQGMDHCYYDIRKRIILSKPDSDKRDDDVMSKAVTAMTIQDEDVDMNDASSDGDKTVRDGVVGVQDGDLAPTMSAQAQALHDAVSNIVEDWPLEVNDTDPNAPDPNSIDVPSGSGSDFGSDRDDDIDSDSDVVDGDNDPDGTENVSSSASASAFVTGRSGKILTRWATMFHNFKSRASAPVDEFLLDHNDIGYRQAIDSLWRANAAETASTTPWYMSKLRHLTTRHDRMIGDETPVTRWDTPHPQVPDFMMKKWIDGQSERVKDFFDILCLVEARGGRDLFQKSYVIDVSQNVDRKTSLGHLGMSGCITPAGLHYHTRLGRLLSGLESLALQGISKEMVHVTTESLSELQSLAGNAMSATVVGCGLLSAIMCAADLLKKNLKSRKRTITASEPPAVFFNRQFLQSVDSNELGRPWLSDSDITTFLLIADSSKRFCFCETHYGEGHPDKVKCIRCGTTACKQCRGDPEHVFESIPRPEHDLLHFHQFVQQHVPRALKVRLTPQMLQDAQAALESTLGSQIGEEQDKVLLQLGLVLSSPEFLDDVIVTFSGHTRSTYWTLRWSTSRLRVHLVLDPERPRWEIFLDAEKVQGLESEQRRLLNDPIATRLISDDGTPQKWRFNLRASGQFCMSIQGLDASAKTMKSQLCIPDIPEEEEWMPSRLSIIVPPVVQAQMDQSHLPAIDGTWTLLPTCGTSHRTLYTKDEVLSGQRLFLFRESLPLQPASLDKYVVAMDCQRLDLRARRDVIVEIGALKASNDVRSLWRPDGTMQAAIVVVSLPNAVELQPSFEELLEPAPLSASLSVYKMNDGATLEPMQHGEDCKKTAVTIAQVSFPYAGTLPVDCSRGVQTVYKEASAKRVFSLFPGVAMQISASANFPTDLLHPCTLSSINGEHCCTICTPPRPRIKWAQKIFKKGAGSSEKLTDEILPAEDPASCVEFETSLRERPAIVTAYFRELNGTISIELTANVRALVHRALGRLHSQARSTPSRTTARFYFDMNFVDMPNSVRTRPFTIPNNRDETPTPYIFDIVSAGTNPITLRLDQQRQLTWMLRIENGSGSNFEQEQMAESVSPGLDIAIRAVAKREVSIRGGLQADEVGFGKTYCSLSLNMIQHPKAMHEAAEAELKGDQKQIHTKATLVLAPSTLLEQWADEARNVWKDVNILVIANMKTLMKTKILDFLNADIVLFSHSLLNDDEYRDRAAELAGMAAWRNAPSPRIFAEFEQLLLQGLEELVQHLRSRGVDGDGSLEALSADLKTKCQTWLKTEKANGLNPKSRRVVGGSKKSGFFVDDSGAADEPEPILSTIQFEDMGKDGFLEGWFANNAEVYKKLTNRHDKALVADRQAEAAIEKLRDVTGFKGVKEWTQMAYPVLSMFHFARKQVDEYHYLSQEQLITVKSIPASACWLISGTPNIGSFADVNTIAEMLGMPLDSDDGFAKLKASKRGFKVGEVLTPLEKHMKALEPQTNVWQDARMTYAQAFLSNFARQNELDAESALPPVDEKTEAVVMNWLHRALYEEMEARMCGSKAYAGASRGDSTIPSHRIDFMRELDGKIREGQNPASALTWLACVDHIQSRSIMQQRANESQAMRWRIGKELEFANAQRFCNPMVNGALVEPKQLTQLKKKHKQQTLCEDPDFASDLSGHLTLLDEVPGVYEDDEYVRPYEPAEYKMLVLAEQAKQRATDAGIITQQAEEEASDTVQDEDGNDDKEGKQYKAPEAEDNALWNRQLHLPALIDHYRHMYRGTRYFINCADAVMQDLDCDTCHFMDKERPSSISHTVFVLAECGHGICETCFDFLTGVGQVAHEEGKQRYRQMLDELPDHKRLEQYRILRQQERAEEAERLAQDEEDKAAGKPQRIRYEGSDVPDNTPFGRCGATFADAWDDTFAEPHRCRAWLSETEKVNFDATEPATPQPVTEDEEYEEGWDSESEDDYESADEVVHDNFTKRYYQTAPGGDKVAAIVKTIKDRSKIGKKERILVFSQFSELSKDLFLALRDAGIQASCCLAPVKAGAASQTSKNEKLIEAFKKGISPVQSFSGQKNADRKAAARVLILPLNSPIAAGHNLQIANHVFFITPYLPDNSGVNVAAQYKQAIGRAQRYGQKKKVTVWRFVNLRTVEVDVWETQLDKKLTVRKPDGVREHWSDDWPWEFVADEAITDQHLVRDDWRSLRPESRKYAIRLSAPDGEH